jgi:hypothetical protein
LRAAVKQPSLFCRSPNTIEANIRGVAERFGGDGLALMEYLRTALKQPSLFTQAPLTVTRHIEDVVARFASDSLKLRDYLQAAVKRPQLFAQSPDTIIGHINLIIDLYHQGLVHFPGQENAPAHQPLKPLFDWLVGNPKFFSLGDDNFALREVSAHATGDGHSGGYLLTKSRYRVESDLAEHLGYADLRTPVSKEPLPEDSGGELGRHARNVLLRALIRAGIVNGGKLER